MGVGVGVGVCVCVHVGVIGLPESLIDKCQSCSLEKWE